MNKSSILLCFMLLWGLTDLHSQHEGNHEKHSETHATSPHKIALFTGYGFISGAVDENGKTKPKIIPVIGVDYEYWFNHKFGLATQNDLELASYSIQDDHQEYIKRNYAFVTSLVFLYEPIPNWALFAGPGYEFEAHHNFPLVKIGTDISKSFEDGWGVGVTLAVDIKEVNTAISLGITISKRLGH